MNILALRYFVKVAHSKNISTAAQELFITQPALSRHLQRLEKEINVTLFERSRGKMTCRITEAGKSCLYDAERILFHADNMFSITQPYSRGERGSLTVGFGGLEGNWLFEWIRQVRMIYPQIEIKPKQLDWRDLAQGIVDRSIDLAFINSGFSFPGEECFQYLEIIPSELQIIVPKSHSLADRDYVTVDELKDQPFVSYVREISPSSYDSFELLCNQYGFSPNYVALYDNTRMILSDIYSNLGIGLYVSSAQKLDEEAFSCISVRLNEEDPWANSKFCLVYNKDNNSQCLQNVIKLIPQITELLGQDT